MILRETDSAGCRQPRGIGVSVSREVDGSREGGFDHSRITDTIQPAMFRKLAVMDRQDDVQSDPTPRGGVVGTHFASARNTSRSSCMISSATAI